MPLSNPHPGTTRSERLWHLSLLTATVVNCVFQIAWFWRFGVHQIMLDGINYVGVAHHLVDGDFKASLHGYWSPLVSWLTAALSVLIGNLELAGKLVTVSSFILCLFLLYLLTLRLWHSRVAAALAVLWFSTARGILALAALSILADFLLTACVLLYFVLLLRALRRNRPIDWTLLGAVHGLAFLAKAIAMPWLSISSLLAVLARNITAPRRLLAPLFLAFLLPVAVWASWGVALRTKYGVFTAGCQLRINLMINWHRWLRHGPPGYSPEFVDMSSLLDKYTVSIVPWSSLQNFHLRIAQLLPMIVGAEFHNVPSAVKETVILLSPAGVLALAAMLMLLARNRRRFPTEAEFSCIALLSTVSLILAYCMLVFDGRYVIPLVPVLIAICSPALLPADGVAPGVAPWIRKSLLGMLVASTAFFAVYWASPFRTVDRDFARSCYEAAISLKKQKSAGTLVSIGNGPYPDRGVGFEVGDYMAYMAGWRLVGQNSALPDSPAQADELLQQVLAARSDAVAVWGSPGAKSYDYIVENIRRDTAGKPSMKLMDPYKGEVGTLVLAGQPGAAFLRH